MKEITQTSGEDLLLCCCDNSTLDFSSVTAPKAPYFPFITGLTLCEAEGAEGAAKQRSKSEDADEVSLSTSAGEADHDRTTKRRRRLRSTGSFRTVLGDKVLEVMLWELIGIICAAWKSAWEDMFEGNWREERENGYSEKIVLSERRGVVKMVSV